MPDGYHEHTMQAADGQGEGRDSDRTGGARIGTAENEAMADGRKPGRPRTRDEETGTLTIRVTLTMLAYLREYDSPGILIEDALKKTAEYRKWSKARKANNAGD